MIYIGTSGWYYRSWQPVFYPEDLPTYKWLKFYAERFNTVEINSTFYRIPSVKTVKEWLKKLPEDFFITCKANRTITHLKKLRDVSEIIRKFFDVISPVRERGGMILFQLPPSIDMPIEILEAFLSLLPEGYRYAMEFRKKGWYRDDVFELLSKYQIAFVSVSAPGLPEKIVNTAPFLYIRFHGKSRWYDYLYSEEELIRWANRLQKFVERGYDIFCYFNNDVGGYAVRNALYLKNLMSSL